MRSAGASTSERTQSYLRARALELPSAPGVADNPRRYAVRLAKTKQKGPIDRITKALKRALEREKTAQK